MQDQTLPARQKHEEEQAKAAVAEGGGVVYNRLSESDFGTYTKQHCTLLSYYAHTINGSTWMVAKSSTVRKKSTITVYPRLRDT